MERGGARGSEGGQAVITNSIHFRNNNTALRVNRGLFPSGSHWSAPSKELNSFTVISCYITGWSSGSASNWIAYLLVLHFGHTDTPARGRAPIFSKFQRLCELSFGKNFKLLEYINIFCLSFFHLYKFGFMLRMTKMYQTEQIAARDHRWWWWWCTLSTNWTAGGLHVVTDSVACELLPLDHIQT